MAIALFCATATASPILLTFQGLENLETVSNFYNGGLGGSGSGPGPADGIVFSDNALALTSSLVGGTGSFAPSSDVAIFFVDGSGITMDVAGGFLNGLSFLYSAPSFVGFTNPGGTADIYSGLDGTGTLLASISLTATQNGTSVGGCSAEPFCPFVEEIQSFSGTAKSVVFAGSENEIGFTDISLGVPEPGTFGSLVLGAAVLTLIRRLGKNIGDNLTRDPG